MPMPGYLRRGIHFTSIGTGNVTCRDSLVHFKTGASELFSQHRGEASLATTDPRLDGTMPAIGRPHSPGQTLVAAATGAEDYA